MLPEPKPKMQLCLVLHVFMSMCHGVIPIVIVSHLISSPIRWLLIQDSSVRGRRLSLEANRALHLAAVLERSLAGAGTLSERCRAAEGAGGGVVVDTDNAHVFGAADAALTGHALGHLYGDGVLAHLEEVSVSTWKVSSRWGEESSFQETYSNTAKAEEAWNILSDLGGLEGGGVSAAGSGVDGST